MRLLLRILTLLLLLVLAPSTVAFVPLLSVLVYERSSYTMQVVSNVMLYTLPTTQVVVHVSIESDWDEKVHLPKGVSQVDRKR